MTHLSNSRRNMTTWLAHCLVCCVLPGLVLASGWTAMAQSGPDEYQVKAAFLFHFAELVDWPQVSDPAGKPSITFCTFEDDLARQEIQNTVDGKKVGTRRFRFVSLRTSQAPTDCDVLFLGRAESRRESATLKQLQGEPVLTVGESDSFLMDGGMIRFHLESGRVRFDINVVAADDSRLRISSRLLLLASYVLRNSPESVGGK